MGTRKQTQVILSFFFIAHVFAATIANDQFTVSGTVPLVMRASLTQSPSNPLVYSVHEVSNSPTGYTVILNTDATSAKYNGSTINVVDGQAIITQITSQSKSIDILKELSFTSPPTYININISVY
jgi:hypothetical protein